MRRTPPARDELTSPSRDLGTSLIEILIAIVLIGTAVGATMSALRVTVMASAVERDHARAQQWLQSASGALRETDYVPCDDPGPFGDAQAHMIADYQAALVSGTSAPPDWVAGQIRIVSPVKVWNGSSYLTPAEITDPKKCFKDKGFALQLINLEVRNPDGKIVETVQVVKDEN